MNTNAVDGRLLNSWQMRKLTLGLLLVFSILTNGSGVGHLQQLRRGDRTPDPSQWGFATDWLKNMFGAGGMPRIPRRHTGRHRRRGNTMLRTQSNRRRTGRHGRDTILVHDGQVGAGYAGRNAANLAAQYANNTMSAQEAAMGRQMSGIPMMQSLGTSTAGLSEAARDRALQGAMGLSNMEPVFKL